MIRSWIWIEFLFLSFFAKSDVNQSWTQKVLKVDKNTFCLSGCVKFFPSIDEWRISIKMNVICDLCAALHSSANIERLNQWILICCLPPDYRAFVCHSINRSRNNLVCFSSVYSYSRIPKKFAEFFFNFQSNGWLEFVLSKKKKRPSSSFRSFGMNCI